MSAAYQVVAFANLIVICFAWDLVLVELREQPQNLLSVVPLKQQF